MALPITIHGLTKRFGATTAVDGVDLGIAAGELFFLLGPSGCGKTTLLRMIAGFTPPTAGTIQVGERDITHLPPNQRNTGMVFQSYALWPHMTVAQNVAFGLSVRKVPRAELDGRVARALAMVQMSDYAQRKPNELSGGQQQRVALARAMVIEPTVLLLDEPLSNLDAKLRLDMRSQIQQICKAANITAVYVTHDQKEALSMADRMAVLQAGKLVQAGPPRELYDRPVNRFVADFLGETNFIPATVRAADGADLLLDSPAGVLRSAVFPRGLAAGAAVTVSLRPEALRRVAESATGGVNVIDTRCTGTTYLGDIAQHHLALGGNLSLKALEIHPRPIAPGATLRVAAEPSDVIVLRD